RIRRRRGSRDAPVRTENLRHKQPAPDRAAQRGRFRTCVFHLLNVIHERTQFLLLSLAKRTSVQRSSATQRRFIPLLLVAVNRKFQIMTPCRGCHSNNGANRKKSVVFV